MKTVMRFLVTIIFLSLLLLPLISAEVVVFDKYSTSMNYDDGVLHVTKNLRLKNTGNTPIIPGEVHFKISKDSKGKTIAPEISSFSVKDKFGKALDTRQISSDKEVDLVFTIWDPLLPDFFYDMTMTYDLEFNPSGILFYQVILPDERTTIPITNAKTSFSLPTSYHVTYVNPDGEIDSEDGVTTVSWKEKASYAVEYSFIPFPRLGFKAVNVFWVLIIILFLINLVLRLRKKARMERYA